MKGYSLAEALVAATNSAQNVMENTKDMMAKMGKAKALGDRAVGYPDPGALIHVINSLFDDGISLRGNS